MKESSVSRGDVKRRSVSLLSRERSGSEIGLLMNETSKSIVPLNPPEDKTQAERLGFSVQRVCWELVPLKAAVCIISLRWAVKTHVQHISCVDWILYSV